MRAVILIVVAAVWALVALPGVVCQAAAKTDLCTTLISRGATCEAPAQSGDNGEGLDVTVSATTFTIPASSTGSSTVPAHPVTVVQGDGSSCTGSTVIALQCNPTGTGESADYKGTVTPTSSTGGAVCKVVEAEGSFALSQGSSPDVIMLSEEGVDTRTTCTLGKAAGTKSTPTASTPPASTPSSLSGGSGGSGGGSSSGSNLGSGSGSGSSGSGNGKAVSNAAMSLCGPCMLLLSAVACGLQMLI